MKSHHTKNRFTNLPGGPPRAGKLHEWLRFFWDRIRDKPPKKLPENHVIPEEEALEKFQETKHQNTLTWLGHACFFIRHNGLNIITDPYLTKRASPFSFMGPKRFVEPGIALENLPQIDIMLISHNHYDHVDTRTLSQLPNKKSIHVVIPLKLTPLFKKMGYSNIHEMDWEERIELNGIKEDKPRVAITCLPAIHFSSRGLFDRNKTLWCGYQFFINGHNIYFAGDTAYGPIFKDIIAHYGPYDLALIPIGAYEPRSLMHAAHVDPEEAVQVGLDISAKVLVPMHWGTVKLTDEPVEEPIIRFEKAAKANNFSDEALWLLKIGETRIF